MNKIQRFFIVFLFFIGQVSYADDDETARLGLEYLQQGMVNSDIIVNQFMDVSDALMLAKAESMFATDPIDVASPTSIWAATHGDLFIIPTNAVGAWSTHTNELAIRINGAWKYYNQHDGMQLMCDYDLWPNSAHLRAKSARRIQYNAVANTWGIVDYNHNKYGYHSGSDKIMDSYTGVDYFGFTQGGIYANAKFKGFIYEPGDVGVAILEAVTPETYYRPDFVVRKTAIPPGQTISPVEIGSASNAVLRWGRLHLSENVSTATPTISDASPYLGTSNSAVIWVANGINGIKGQLYFTNAAGSHQIQLVP